MCKVSVVINCYNGAEFLQETLDSVRNQTFQDYEIVFIDNCSTDSSADIAKAFGEKLKYFKTEKNIPLGFARNYAIERCAGEFIAFLDSDDLWDKDKLKIQVAQLEQYKECVINIANNLVLNMMANTSEIVIRDRKTGFLEYDDFAINYKYGLSSVMIRTESLKKMSKIFDTRLSYAEEFDMFLRLALLGKVYFDKSPLSTYRLHDTMHSLKLKDTIPYEYGVVIENLVETLPEFSLIHPNVIKRIEFLRDYTDAKLCIEKGKLKKSHKLMKPYIKYNKRALFFYILTVMPKPLVEAVYNIYFTKKTL